FFFFSSRRRHTRWPRDWSSDVCSSDLTPDSYLRYLAERGLHYRYGSDADSEAIRNRLNYELGVIHQMGFDTYFLIVWDLCQFARSEERRVGKECRGGVGAGCEAE